MREKTWRKWEVAGLFFVLIWGNLFHFVYNWSGQNDIVAAIAAVNESVWEHIKLLIVPWVLWSAVEAFALRRSRGSVLAPRAAALVVGALFIPVAYYSYTGVTGSSVSIVNIIIFQLAVLLAFFLSWRMQEREKLRGKGWAILGAVVLLALLALTVVWTYYPPQLPPFADPRSGQWGLPPNE